MRVVTSPFPALGFDCVTPMTAERAAGLRDAGLKFAVRYLGSVTAAELAVILDAGLLFMPVTYSRQPGWTPTANMGTDDGRLDVSHLTAAGVPRGCTVWVDLEGVGDASAAAVAVWVNERGAVLRDAGYDVGLYVGEGDVLDSGELYALSKVDRYWRSLSRVPEPTCGFSLLQLPHTVTIAGTEVDVDCVQFDFHGRLPMMVAP